MAEENMGELRAVVTRAEAMRAGLTRYWTGLPCKSGHVADRKTVSGQCIACAADGERRYRAAHPEKFREKWRNYETSLKASPEKKAKRMAAHNEACRKYAANNPEKMAARKIAWDAANPERKLEHGRRWRERNLEVKQAKVREWRDANRDKPEYKEKAYARVKKWNKENPEGVRKNTHARRARLKGATGSHTKEQLIDILKLQKWKCAETTCRVSLRDKRHLDHIVALAKGGTNNADNLQYLCPTCNNRKHVKDPFEWAKANGRLL